ncbi:MAG: Na+/H+ antiporter NhaC family protein [Bacteroidaceae bacterium]|nr:Na+/H+ antiporter NhaC family protein [Bacteroidaceae bacterium]
MKSLSPILVFICLYLVTSLVAQDFYKVPITVAFLVSSVYAVSITKGTLAERLEIYAEGVREKSMMLMLWIFLLAGAFATLAKSMGAIDATVSLALDSLPSSFLLPGIFLAACFISLAVGTSVGTIAALTPVAVGIADEAHLSLPFVVAIVVGGAYFGDNLSFISDTTIVATQTQGCKMSDKFRVNSRIVLPAALLILFLYYVLGREITPPTGQPPVSFWKVLPYLSVVILAVCGINVLIVLLVGILLCGIIGITLGEYDLFGWFQAMADGMESMSELIIMTLLAAGLLSVVRHNGGIRIITTTLTRHINSRQAAEFVIAALVSLVNICTANNTVAIMTAGPIAADISQRFGIDPRKAASLLDTASCFTQALLPYGAQMLIAAGLAQVSPLSILPHLYYPMALVLAVLLSILLRYPRKYSQAA